MIYLLKFVEQYVIKKNICIGEDACLQFNENTARQGYILCILFIPLSSQFFNTVHSNVQGIQRGGGQKCLSDIYRVIAQKDAFYLNFLLYTF